jgi:hypothetical protein
MKEVSVIVDNKFVDYVPKSEAVAEIAQITGMRNAAIDAKQTAMREKRQSDDRLIALRGVMTRLLGDVNPAEKGWSLTISPSDMQELRAMLDLKAEFA